MTYNRLTFEEFISIYLSEAGKDYRKFIEIQLKDSNSKNITHDKGYEIHHIIPRAYGGAEKDKNNLIKLKTKDHIMAHFLLAKMTDNIMMYQAFNCIIGLRYNKITDLDKIDLKNLDEWAEIRKISKQRMFSDEARKTISEKAKERWAKWKETGRVDEIKQTISETTKQGMKESKTAQIRTRVNLGSKKYYNETEDREMNWYPGMPEPDPKYWRRGRRPNSEESKKKLKETLNKHHKKFYHNDELKTNTTFDDTEIIPEGWVIGQKPEYMGNNNKFKKKQQINTLNTLKKQTI